MFNGNKVILFFQGLLLCQLCTKITPLSSGESSTTQPAIFSSFYPDYTDNSLYEDTKKLHNEVRYSSHERLLHDTMPIAEPVTDHQDDWKQKVRQQSHHLSSSSILSNTENNGKDHHSRSLKVTIGDNMTEVSLSLRSHGQSLSYEHSRQLSNTGLVTVCASANENQAAVVQCPSGYRIRDITFASYGLPGGSCNNWYYGDFDYYFPYWYGYYYYYRYYTPVYCYRSYFCGPRYYYYWYRPFYYCSMYSVCSYRWYSYRAYGRCHSTNSIGVVNSLCRLKERCDVPAANYLFGDPCYGVGKRLAIQATCEGGCSDFRVPYIYGARWQRIDSNRVKYICSSGFYNSAAGVSGGNPTNNGDIATCNGGSYDTSGITLTCRPVERGYYSYGDNNRYECNAGTFSYWWHTTAASPACSGYCSPGYFCPKGSSSPHERECGSIDKYCPTGSSAPLTVPRGYLSGPQTYTIWWGYSWWYYWWYWYSTPNPYWFVRTFPYPVTRRYYIEPCPAGRKCSNGDLQPVFQFEEGKVCGGANSSFSITVVEDNQETKQLGSTIFLNVSDYTGSVVWNLTNDVYQKDHYWYSSFLVSPLYHGLYTWNMCNVSALSIVNINQKSAMVQLRPSENLNIEKCGRRFPLTIRASMANDDSAAVTCILNVDVVRALRPPVIIDCLPRKVEEGGSSGTPVGQPLVGAQMAKNNIDKINQPGVSIRWTTNSTDFAIDTCSGQLYTANTLWRNAGGTLRTVQITAIADGSAMGMGTASVYCNLQVTLTRQNNLPAISTTSLSIPELRPNDTFVGQVIATDVDKEDLNALVYSFGVRDATDPLAFRINSTGAVFTTKEFDVIKYPKREYKYFVNVSDTLGTSSREITIQITPEDRVPIMQAQTISVYEDTPVNTKIKPAVSATHPQGKNMTWSIAASTSVSIFNITYDGYLYIIPGATVDYYVQASHSLTVAVTDTSSKSTSAIITVQIIEVNTRPSFANKVYNGTIDEYAKPGTNVKFGSLSTLTATDRNTNDKLTYSFVNAQPYDALNMFSIDATSGLIKVASNSLTTNGIVYDTNLTYVTLYTYYFTVNVTDDGIPSLWTTTSVKVSLTNIRPRIISDIIYAPLDAVTDGLAIGNVSLWQASMSAGLTGNLSLRYSINSPSESLNTKPVNEIAYNAFFIDSVKGSIASSNASAIDYLRYRSYPLNITANYRVPLTYEATAPASAPNSSVYSADNATDTAFASSLSYQEVSTYNLVYIYLLHRNRAPVWRSSLPRVFASQREYGSCGVPLIGYVDDPDTLLPSYELNETLTFSILSGNTPDNAIYINATTGQLVVVKPLSSYLQYVWGAAPPTVNLTVQVCDQGKSSDVNYTTINILCNNANVTIEILEGNLPPVIRNSTVSKLSVMENATVSTLVGNPFEATDPDIGQTLTWSLLSSGSSTSVSFFRIDKFSGQLRVNGTLDFETQSVYNLIIVVTDNGRIPLSTAWYVTVSVIDINEPPSLVQYVPAGGSLPLTVPENSPIQSYVGQLIGTDPDKADYGNQGNNTYSYLTYSILDPLSCAFSIDRSTGAIFVLKPKLLNTEINPVLTCQFIVYDSGWDGQKALNATLTLSVSILNRNDAPTVEDSRYLVTEGNYLAQYSGITVMDEDILQPHRWYLTRPNSFCWYYRQSLSLWYFTSVLSAFGLTAPYDFAPVPIYTYDGGNKQTLPSIVVEFRVRGSGTARVTVSTGPNENNLRYEVTVSSSNVAIYRNSVRNIKSVQGRGLSAKITSQFVSTPTLLGITAVRNYTLDPDGLSWSHYTLRIDMNTGTIGIGLRPDNDPENANQDKQFLSISDNEFAVFRSTLWDGGSLYVGSTTDNPDQRISSICFTNNINDQRSSIRRSSFYMSPLSSLLYSYNLDYERIQYWGLEVMVQDIPDGVTATLMPFNAKDYTVVTINVMDTNEPPYFPETSRLKNCDNVRFAFMSSGINIMNNNDLDNPTVVLCTSMDENAVEGQSIGTITEAIDPDTFDPLYNGYVLYTATYGDDGNKYSTAVSSPSAFSTLKVSTPTTLIDIDMRRNGARTAYVKYNNTFDYEKASMYAIPVWAKDKGNLFSDVPGYVIITLNDVNEPPSIVPKKDTLSVPENSFTGTFVGKPEDLGASDPDIRNRYFSTLTYAIVGGSGKNHFSINATTGQIIVDNIRNGTLYPLNFEVTATYTLLIQVTDGPGLLSNIASIIVSLTNVNDVPVMKLPLTITVDENYVGEFGPLLDISDEDVGSILTLSPLGGTGFGIFSASACAGRLSAIANPDYNSMFPESYSLSLLDFETQSSYSLILSLIDNGTPSLSVMGNLTVIVRDTNEPPSVSPNFVTVDEGTVNNTVIGLPLDMLCWDPDQLSSNTAWARLTYTIVFGNTYNLFRMDNTTGQLIVNKDLVNLVDPNTETEVTYALIVAVQDGGGLMVTTTVTVTVIGTNYAPTFITANNTVLTIDEDCPRSRRTTGEIVGRADSNTIIATDRNVKQIQDLSFQLFETVPSFAIDYFSFQSLHSGIIQLTVTSLGARPNILDYETIPNITVVIKVTDPRGAVGYGQIIIDLFNRNEDPYISYDPSEVALHESAPTGTNLLTSCVRGDNEDSVNNLRYTITGGNEAGIFGVNPSSGGIFVRNNSKLDYETTSEYRLTITVQDTGKPENIPLSATTKLTISIIDVNENPFWTASPTVYLYENSLVNTQVAPEGGSSTLRASVNDVDRGDGFSLSFSINETAWNRDYPLYPVLFIIDTNGNITVSSNLPSDQIASYLDYDRTPNVFKVSTIVTDRGNLSANGIVNVQLYNVNEPPAWQVPSILSFYSILKDNTIISKPLVPYVTDADFFDTRIGEKLAFYFNHTGIITNVALSPSFSIPSCLLIDALTGQISFGNTSGLPNSPTGIIEFNTSVCVRDNGNLYACTPITIRTTDKNTPPKLSPVTLSIDENTPGNTVVTTLVATDAESSLGQKVSYTLYFSSSSAGSRIPFPFELVAIAPANGNDPGTAQVRVIPDRAYLLDFESLYNKETNQAIFEGILTVTDNHPTVPLTISTTIVIYINDVNELPSFMPVINTTIIPRIVLSVNENSITGTELSFVPTLSSDTLLPNVYSASRQNKVVHLLATDPDADDAPTVRPLVYSWINAPLVNTFTIRTDGVIQIGTNPNVTLLDFETVPVSVFRAKVTDRGGLSAFIDVEIRLQDINEISYFVDTGSYNLLTKQPATSFTFTLSEATPSGTAFGKLLVKDIDRDDKGRLIYSLTPNEESGPFVIDSKTGTLSLSNSSSFDWEDTVVWSPEIQIMDSSSNPLVLKQQLTVRITDVPDALISNVYIHTDDNPTNDTLFGIDVTTDPYYFSLYSNVSRVLGTTEGGLNITFTGNNLGPSLHRITKDNLLSYLNTPSQLTTVTATYGPTTGMEYVAKNCYVRVPGTSVTCQQTIGFGLRHVWKITINTNPSLVTGGGLSSPALIVNPSVITGYLPPSIRKVSFLPNSQDTFVSTLGGTPFVIEGNNFGPLGTSVIVRYRALVQSNTSFFSTLSGKTTVTYTANNCSITKAHTTIVCEAVGGIGYNLSFAVQIGMDILQTSLYTDPTLLSYQKPTLSLVTINNLVNRMNTRGNEIITVRGTNFGPLSMNRFNTNNNLLISLHYAPLSVWRTLMNSEGYESVTIMNRLRKWMYSSVDCSIVKEDTEIQCTSVAGLGSHLYPILIIGGQLSDTRFINLPPSTTNSLLHYQSPVVTKVLGNQKDTLNTVGGQIFQLVGDNFGPIYANDYDTILNDDTMIVALTNDENLTRTPKVNYGYVYKHRLPPVFKLVSDTVSAPQQNEGCEAYGRGNNYCEEQCSTIMWTCLPTTGTWNKTVLPQNKVCIVPVPPNRYIPSSPILIADTDAQCKREPALQYTAMECQVMVPHTVMECRSAEGIGAYLSAQIASLSGQSSSVSWPSTLSYASPVLTYYEGDGAHDADTRGGQSINIFGTNFGPLGTPFDVTYGIDGGEYIASNCSMVEAHTQIACTTIEGAGARLTFRVRIDNQYSTVPLMDYSMPIIDSITGTGAESASTEGGDTVDITGRYFGGNQNYLDFVTYGPSGVENTARDCRIIVNHTVIRCTLVPGTGRRLRWIVSIRGQLSKPSIQTTSYGAPNLLTMSVNRGGTSGTTDVTLIGYNLLGANGQSNILIAFNPYGFSGNNVVINNNEWINWYNKTVSGDPTATPWPSNIGKWFTYATYLSIKGTGVSLAAEDSLTPTTHLQSILIDIPSGCGANREIFIIVDNIPSNPLIFTYTSPIITNVIAVKNPNNLGTLTVVVEGTNFCSPPSTTKQSNSLTGLALANVMSNGASKPSTARERRLLSSSGTESFTIESTDNYGRILQSSSTNSSTLNDNAGSAEDTSSYLIVGGIPTLPSLVTNNILVINVPEPAASGGGFSIPINIGGPGINAIDSGTTVTQVGPSFANITLAWYDIDTVGGTRILIPNVLSLGTNNTAFVYVTVGQRNCTGLTIVKSFYYGNTVNPPVDESTSESIQYTWYNLSCIVPYGIGENVPVQINSPTGSSISISALLSYKAPVITNVLENSDIRISYNMQINAANGIPTNGTRVTILGNYFGTNTKDSPPIITLTNPLSNIVQSYPSIVSYTQNNTVFDVPSGQGTNIAMTVSVGNQVTSVPVFIRYGSPTVTKIIPQNVSTSGGTVISVYGTNFGTASITDSIINGRPIITLNNRACDLVSRTNNPTTNSDIIMCTLPEGEGRDIPLSITVAGQTNAVTSTSLFTYASPSITYVSHTHGPTSGNGVTMLIRGTNFGTYPIVKFIPTISGFAKGLQEITVTSSSMIQFNHTTLTFNLPEGVGHSYSLHVLAGNQLSIVDPLYTFSYDLPALSYRHAREGFDYMACLSRTALVPRTRDYSFVNRTTIGNCYPTIGNVNIVINGTNLGASNVPIQVYIGTSKALLSLNTSELFARLPLLPVCNVQTHTHDSVLCTLPPGMGDNLPLFVVVGDQINILNAPLFSYDPPVITSIIPNVPDGNGEEIIISGYNFGIENSTVTVQIGDLSCLNSYWVNDSMIICTTQRTVVGSKDLEIVAGGRETPMRWSADEEMIVVKCKSGSYGLQDEVCINCATDEPGAICPGSERYIDKVVSAPGFYRLNITQSQIKNNQTRDCHPLRLNREACPVFLPCEPPEACLGGNMCKAGYVGDRCSTCDADYYRISNKCRPCPDRNSVLIIIFTLLGVITLCVMFITAKRFISWPLVAIILDYGQILSLFNRFSIAWPNYVRLTILASSATTFNLELIAPECSLSNVSPEGRWAAAQLMPIVAWTTILLTFFAREIAWPEIRRLYVVFELWRKGTTRNPIASLNRSTDNTHKASTSSSKGSESNNDLAKPRRSWAIISRKFQPYGAVLLATFRLLFIYIARNTLDVFDCSPTTPDISGKKYLGGNINIPCYEKGSVQMDILPAAIVSILVFLVAIPLYGIYQLNRHRKVIFEDMMAMARGYRLSEYHQESRTMNVPAANFRAMYHVLYHHFKPSRYSWEYIIGLRKFALVFVSLMFNRTAVFQQTLVLLILLVSFGIHLRIKPYLSHERSAKLLQSYDPRIQLSTARELGRIAQSSSNSSLNSPTIGMNNVSTSIAKHSDEVDGVELSEKERLHAATNASTRKRILHLKTLFTVESVDTLVVRGLLLQYPALAFFVDPNVVETVLLASLILFNLLGIMLGSSIFTGVNLDRFYEQQYDEVCAMTMVLLAFTFLYILICIIIDIALRIDPEIVNSTIVKVFGRLCSSKIAVTTRDILFRQFEQSKARAKPIKKQFHMSNMNSIGLDVAKQSIGETPKIDNGSSNSSIIGRATVLRTKSGRFVRSTTSNNAASSSSNTVPMNTSTVVRNPLAVSVGSDMITNPLHSDKGMNSSISDTENVVNQSDITLAISSTVVEPENLPVPSNHNEDNDNNNDDEDDGWSDNEDSGYSFNNAKRFANANVVFGDDEDEDDENDNRGGHPNNRTTFTPVVSRH